MPVVMKANNAANFSYNYWIFLTTVTTKFQPNTVRLTDNFHE